MNVQGRIRARGNEAGQVLPLVALAFVALLGMSALAIDVSRLYSEVRFDRSVADAASLAGAQDLQQPNSKAVGSAEWTKARDHAMDVLVAQLHATSKPKTGTCSASAQIVNCQLPGTPYTVNIQSPGLSCVTCDLDHSVEVTVRQAQFPVTFAALFGQTSWDAQATSVAGINFAAKYAVITLRPPHGLKNDTDKNKQDIDINGTKTRLNVHGGDVGTNTSAFTNSGALLTLDSGYLIHHIDDISPDPWNKDFLGNPKGKLIVNLIPDPNYRIPLTTGLPAAYPNMAAGEDKKCSLAPAAPPKAVCYKPGIYTHEFNDNKNTDIEYLESGRYFFQGGLDISGTLIGGNVTAAEGVIIVVPNDQSIKLNNAKAVSLNSGPDTCNDESCRSGPALDFDGTPLKTAAGLTLTIEVPRLGACFSGLTPIDSSCSGSSVINMPGNGNLRVAGVVYAPSDNIKVDGNNSGTVGTIGQLVGWTITYSGGASLNQTYPGGESAGILRLDEACSAFNSVCTK
jgi:hypothetical protein